MSKTIWVFGDSYSSENKKSEVKNWPNILSEKFGCSLKNMSIPEGVKWMNLGKFLGFWQLSKNLRAGLCFDYFFVRVVRVLFWELM